ncbi:sigma-54 dependent transcriptional regulator [Microbaculum marinum]|uniref:Sigma-54 dependent transcriptional regulator n=1 Tax=Microbaculum marinum TaxID=1764581 RepID=A0AAW9RNH1_9HYPH
MASADSSSILSRVLVVDSDPVFRRVVREQIAATFGRGAVVLEADVLADVPGLHADTADVLLLSVGSPHTDVVAEVAQASGHLPVVAVSATGSLSLAVSAMRAGAADFLVKPARSDVLCAAIQRAASRRRHTNSPMAVPTADFERFIGRSDVMRGVFEMISRIAPSRAPVFVTGESGTGKELTAEAIHARSGRTGKFVAINCAAIPRDLMESEIFGHVRGAFTGAQDDRTGAAELADGGTLFLDEICEMEADLQTKLLRFIQSGTVRKVGDTRLKPVDVRFVCATNRDPTVEVGEGRFRSDLYYRLHVLPVHLPPLRQRRDDILPLAEAVLSAFAEEEGRRFTGFDARSRALLLNFDWPGNVRQLQNVVRRVVVMNDGDEIAAEMLAMAMAHAGYGGDRPVAQHGSASIAAPTGRPAGIEPFWLQEKRIIEEALCAHGGNVGRAAAALGISPSTIYRKKQGWTATSSAA